MRYALPVPEENIHEWNKRKSPAHVSKLKNSVDFICDTGTDIFAARHGKIVYVKKDSDAGGPYKKYWNEGNRIVIKHDKGEYSAYEHNKHGSTRVKVGENVKKGQKIAEVGQTGYAFEPHLHFEVFVEPDEEESEGTTIPVSFGIKRRYSDKCKTSVKMKKLDIKKLDS